MNKIKVNEEHHVIGHIRPTAWRPSGAPRAAVVSAFEDGLQLACLDWKDRSRVGRLKFAREVIGYAGTFDEKCLLSWTFSPATVSCADALKVAARWDETGEPPIFSLVSLEFGAETVRTTGLKAFAELEIELRNVQSRTSDAMNLTARLARHVLLFGPSIAAKSVSAGPLKATFDLHVGKGAQHDNCLRLTIQD
jgi:hypothetical protein